MELLHNQPQFCFHCKGINIIEDVREGCRVCTTCGLVASSFLLDPLPKFDERRDVNSTEASWFRPGVQRTKRDLELIMLLDKLDIESMEVESFACDIMNEWKEKKYYKGNFAPLRAFAIYEACRKFNILSVDKVQICYVCETDPKHFQQFQTSGQHVIDNKINERIMKLACAFITDRKQRMTAIRHVTNIEAKLKMNQIYMNKKPSKMDAVIFFHVCTSILQIKMKKGEYVRDCDVSAVTFNKHMKFLKSLL
jgi:transcription initiation factor TFIIIB Brf1 subunit/transcription initiation factor TFIIB